MIEILLGYLLCITLQDAGTIRNEFYIKPGYLFSFAHKPEFEMTTAAGDAHRFSNPNSLSARLLKATLKKLYTGWNVEFKPVYLTIKYEVRDA